MSDYHKSLLKNFPMGIMYRKDIVIIKEDVLINLFEKPFLNPLEEIEKNKWIHWNENIRIGFLFPVGALRLATLDVRRTSVNLYEKEREIKITIDENGVMNIMKY